MVMMGGRGGFGEGRGKFSLSGPVGVSGVGGREIGSGETGDDNAKGSGSSSRIVSDVVGC